jgi:hypothetical protein
MGAWRNERGRSPGKLHLDQTKQRDEPGWTIFRIPKFEKSKKLRPVKDFLLQNTKKRKKNSVAHLVPHAPQKFWPKF